MTPVETTNLGSGPGQPIAKSTGELMMALYQARIKAVAEECPDLGIKAGQEPRQLFFKLTNINELLATLNSISGSGYVATCLGLTVQDAQGNPVSPSAEDIALMQD